MIAPLARGAIPLAVVCIAVDQLVKYLVRVDLSVCRETPIVDCQRLHVGPLAVANVPAVPPAAWSMPSSPPWIRVQNTGAGYVLVRDPAVAFGLALLGCLLIVLYTAWVRNTSWVAILGIGLQAGGALSNLLDRLLAGRVTDYVNLTPTFTFNLADVFLVVGAVLATIGAASALVKPASRRERTDAVPAP